MSGNYVLPFRRSEADGPRPDTAPTERSTPSSFDYQNNRHDNRGRGMRGGRGDRGFNGMRRHGGGRGGRGGRGRGYKNNFFQKNQGQDQDQGPPVDDADLYQPRDIDNHFWGGERQDDTYSGRSSTFHNSKAHPDKLSYMFLFIGANPRWANDRIVFAKSKLNLLPEYREKKAERGEWEQAEEKSTSEFTEGTTENAVGFDAAQLNTPDDGTVGIDDGKPKEDTESTSVEKGDVPTKAAGTSTPSTGGKNQEANETPTEAPKNTTARTTPSSNSRMKYTDIRLLPANSEPEPPSSSPTYPAIPPIDYVPSRDSTNPIAVFEARRPVGFRNRDHFLFTGWFRITRVNILAPNSAELVRMQQQKWKRHDRFGNPAPSRERDAAAWDAALGSEWAVVKFEPLTVGEGGEAPPPSIERLPEPERETKGVNELLSKMRLGDGGNEGVDGGEKNIDLEGQGDKVDETQVSGQAEATTNVDTETENSAPAP